MCSALKLASVGTRRRKSNSQVLGNRLQDLRFHFLCIGILHVHKTVFFIALSSYLKFHIHNCQKLPSNTISSLTHCHHPILSHPLLFWAILPAAWSFLGEFIHSFSKYLLNTYYMFDTILSTDDIVENYTHFICYNFFSDYKRSNSNCLLHRQKVH